VWSGDYLRVPGGRVLAVSEEFFTPPPPAEDPEPQPPSPPWMGPPYGVLPGVASLELVIARNDRAAVYVGRCSVYPTGFELELRVLAAADAGELDPSLNGIYHRPGRGTNYEDMLRFGLEFDDGRKATNVGGFAHRGEEPQGPVLWGMGGGGGGGRWQQDFWVWPLPPPGPLTLACEWPAAGIKLNCVEVDSQLLRNASARARELFPDRASSVSGGTWSSLSAVARKPRSADPGD
jgi:hypothetical protein